MVNLGAKKAYIDVSLDESEDSPTFRLDMSDEAIAEKVGQAEKVLAKVTKLQRELSGNDALDKAKLTECAKVLRKCLEFLVGKDEANTIIDWVKGDGNMPDYAVVSYVSVIVKGLMEVYAEHYEPIRRAAEQKYVKPDSDAFTVL